MERRSGATPMEFEYENKGGQVDPNSPWVTSASNRLQNFGSQTWGPSSTSPQKQSSPNRHQAKQSKPLPQTPRMKPPPLFPSAFNAIREPLRHEFSSGPENQSSPENADNEDTPEPLKMKRGNWQDSLTINNNNNVTVFRDHKSPSKRTSFSDMFGLKRFSPGRSAFRKRHDRDVLAKRAHKRKRREIERDDHITYRRPSDDSSSDDRPQPGNANTTTPEESWLATIIRNIVANPVLPHVLSHYVQLLWNMFLVFFFMYILYSFLQTIRQDVDMKSEELAAKTMAEMTICAREYVQNKCDRDSRVPAMEMLCENWENCMNRDPQKVGRARVSAHTFAEIFNSFIEPISYKAMGFSLTIVFGCFAISNYVFKTARNKVQHTSHQDQYPHSSFQQGNPVYQGAVQYTPRHDQNTMALTQLPERYNNGPRSPSKSYESYDNYVDGSRSPMKGYDSRW